MLSSVRLDKETHELLRRAVQSLAVTKSEVVRAAIREYCASRISRRSPWEIYASVHAAGGSGHGRRLADSHQILKGKAEKMRKRWS